MTTTLSSPETTFFTQPEPAPVFQAPSPTYQSFDMTSPAPSEEMSAPPSEEMSAPPSEEMPAPPSEEMSAPSSEEIPAPSSEEMPAPSETAPHSASTNEISRDTGIGSWDTEEPELPPIGVPSPNPSGRKTNCRDLHIEMLSETEFRVVGSGVLYSHPTLIKFKGRKRYQAVSLAEKAWHFEVGKSASYDEVAAWVANIQAGFVHPDFDTPKLNNQKKWKKRKGEKSAVKSGAKPTEAKSTNKKHGKKKTVLKKSGNVTFASTPATDSRFQTQQLRVPRPHQGQRIHITIQRGGQTLKATTVIDSVSTDKTGFVRRATFLQNGGAEIVTLIISDFRWQIRGEINQHSIRFIYT